MSGNQNGFADEYGNFWITSSRDEASGKSPVLACPNCPPGTWTQLCHYVDGMWRCLECGFTSSYEYMPAEGQTMTTQAKPLETGKQTRELKAGLVETSILCPNCEADFFLTTPNHVVVATCPACGWPDLTRRFVDGDEQ